MNKAELINAIAASTELTKKDAEKALSATLEAITNALAQGDKVQGLRLLRGEEARRPHRPQSPHQGAHRDPRFRHARVQGRQGSEGRRLSVIFRKPQLPVWAPPGSFLERNRYASRQVSEGLPAHQAPQRRQRGLDNGLVSVNDRPVRASYEVKEGDRITLRFGVRTMTVEVLAVEESPRKDAASAMYRQISKNRPWGRFFPALDAKERAALLGGPFSHRLVLGEPEDQSSYMAFSFSRCS